MTRKYLLDTNIASYVIKGNVPAVRRRLERLPMWQVAVSAVTQGELRYGVARRPEALRLGPVVEEFLLRVTVQAWDAAAAAQYGRVRAALERNGRPMGNLDLMIASHALSLGAILVTNDRAFTGIDGLRLENWTQ